MTDQPVITPWSVDGGGGTPQSGIDYDRVLIQFKSQRVDPALLAALPCAAHHFLTRGIAFSHRDFDKALAMGKGGTKGMYLYTGRGPSSASMHLGHMVPFLLTRYLQEKVFPRCPLVVQLTDDEKFLFRDIPLGTLQTLARENLKDIMAMGLDRSRTFAFLNTGYIQHLYPTTLRVQKQLTANAVRNTFGLTESDNVGKYAFPAVQAAPCFSECFPTVLGTPGNTRRAVIPCAIDQDPFFVLTRRVAQSLKAPRPALLHTTFVPALKGTHLKMSSSQPEDGIIFLSDTDDVVRKKIKSAFSGGRPTLEEFQRLGGDTNRDVAFQLIRTFCPCDATVADLAAQYGKGTVSSGAMKEKAGDVVLTVMKEWRERRAAISEEHIVEVLRPRPLTE